MSVQLALLSHTNAGKTSLVRTLLRRDVGEVADRPHVTEDAERHVLVEGPAGEVLYLWDTPGFGDSARLAKRLRASANPLGWLQTQVWDRFTDRAFFCSQRAMHAAREHADLVLYLANAAEDPGAAGYVEAELEILRWLGKPVLLLLNQGGADAGAHARAAEEARWSQRLAAFLPRRDTLALDAFARCWVQEDRLMAAAAALLDAAKQPELAALRTAWRERNLGIFHQSMVALAAALAATAADAERLGDRLDVATLGARVRGWLDRGQAPREDPATAAAMRALLERTAAREREAVDKLIELHGLAGRAGDRILAATAGRFEVTRPADVARTGVMGGVVSGALGGLAADIASGGLTLGAGAIVGAIVGALGAGGAAHAYNVLQGETDGRVRWSAGLLEQRASESLVRYLAVAHFGRARGAWVEDEAPAHWAPIVAEAVAAARPDLSAAWMLASEGSAEAARARLAPALTQAARAALERLYPDATTAFTRG